MSDREFASLSPGITCGGYGVTETEYREGTNTVKNYTTGRGVAAPKSSGAILCLVRVSHNSPSFLPAALIKYSLRGEESYTRITSLTLFSTMPAKAKTQPPQAQPSHA
jgi:hypothetical protein